MKQCKGIGIALGAAFFLAACDSFVPEQEAYCERTGLNSFKVVDATYGSETIYNLKKGTRHEDTNEVYGRVEISGDKNRAKDLAMVVDTGEKSCRVNDSRVNGYPSGGGAMYKLKNNKAPSP